MKGRLLDKILILTIASCIVNSDLFGQVNLTVVYPHLGPNNMEIKWNPVVGAQEYEYHKKVNNGAYSAWISTALNTTVMDNGLAAGDTYTYQVRVKVAGVWSAASNEKKNRFTMTWPVRKASNGTTESVELLHGFGQPIAAGGSKYFHEGMDVHGEETVDNEVVRAPAGGIILHNGGTGSDIYVAIQFSIGGVTKYLLFNHLQKNNTNLIVNESVAEGDSLGVIANGIWNTLTSHTHVQSYTNANDFITTAQNPMNFFTSNAHRDPQEKDPEVSDGNGDGESIRFRKAPNSSDYFPNDGKVHNGVDVVAECIDKQSSDAPFQVPKVVGYYIQRRENGAWQNAVKSDADPYILVDNINYYQSHSGSPNTPVVTTIIDYADALKSKAPNTPAGYQFQQWFTYIVTNTKGNDGKIANLDSNQYWATDARKTVAEANGYKTGYDKARSVDEAKFPDGKYKVMIRLRDFVKSPADAPKEIQVDNFRPYVKKVEIKSGKLNYSANWKWEDGAGQLKLEDNKDTTKACGKVTIKITTSEPMKNVDLEISTLSFSKSNTTPVAGTDAKEWEFEVPEASTKDKPEGPHKLLITGKDSADNVLQGFTSKSDIPGASLHKKQLDGTWLPAAAPVKDNIHEFKLSALKDKMSVTTTDASDCNKKDGKATIEVTDVKGELEYSVDGGAWQTSKEFKDLAVGTHKAKARIKGDDCEGEKEFEIKEKDPLKVSVSGFGTTEFCNNANPPTVTLTASASGGSGKYEYSWPGGTLNVTGSGSYSVTVTDTATGCKADEGGEVIFVPIVCSRDPNDIIGPEGFGPGKMISKFQAHPYIIRFENDPDFATAPAQVVKINHPVDSTVNLLSVRLGNFGFSNLTFNVPPNKTFYSTRLDVTDSLGIVVDVTAGIDVDKREVFWIFESKDPLTGLPPSDSHLGFLPVNDSSGKGEGYVTFTIRPASKTVTGDTINAKASIVFDLNTPLATPAIFNTIDAVAPVSAIKSLPATTDSSVLIRWSGSDDPKGSGIRDYTLYVSQNGGPFAVYQSGIKDTLINFRRGPATTYSFFTIATDNTGNQEALKTAGEVTIVLPGIEFYRSIITGSWNNLSTWQSSVDSATWLAATVIPSSTSKSITIQKGHTVTVTENTTTDETFIEAGAALAVAAGKTFNVVNNGLTLRSKGDSSATIAETQGTITGNVVVERHIPLRSAWRLLTVPLSNAQTIRSAWQEGGVYTPGYGTHITGGTSQNGFDQGSSTVSIKGYNQNTNSFEPLTSTLTPLSSQPGYLLLVRGDRGIDLSLPSPAPNNTVLRAVGGLKVGAQPAIPVAATGFTLVGNPYASPVDFTKVDKTNVPKRFYVFDPKRAAAGAFVLFDSADNYTPLVTGGNYPGRNTAIQSGQAFMVEGMGIAGTMNFTESNKIKEQRNVFRTNDGLDEKLQINLHYFNADSSVVIADAAAAKYNNVYSWAVTPEDAGKPDNIDENLAIVRAGKTMMVERRPLIDSVDTIYLKIYNVRPRKYQFEIIPDHFLTSAFSPYLEDKYLSSSTLLSLTSPTKIRFEVNGDSASAMADRFKIVFKANRALPLMFTTINAFDRSGKIQVNWNVDAERNIRYYEVQKSPDGQNFRPADTTMPLMNNTRNASYEWLDLTPFAGDNFYRIKVVENSGDYRYSEIVNVKLGDTRRAITLYPNPVKNRTVFLRLTNQAADVYRVQVFNKAGQQVYVKTIQHPGGSATQTLYLRNVVSKGIYDLQLSTKTSKTVYKLIIVE